MKTTTFEAPAMYADHHVTEVRRILLEMPGVQDVIASSAFLAVEVTFDPDQVQEAAIRDALDAAGYLQAIPMGVETGAAEENRSFPRHSAVVAQAGTKVSFAQDLPSPGLPALSCPGIGVLRMED
jgi:copper chaperone CopZ